VESYTGVAGDSVDANLMGVGGGGGRDSVVGEVGTELAMGCAITVGRRGEGRGEGED
jgi:hypothetical protein